MILSLLIIIVIALTAFWWGNQGTFSAFLHMLCCLVAGAVAFAAWEPAAYLLLRAEGLPKFVLQFSWGLGLAVPFLVTFGGLRLLSDRLVKANLTMQKSVDLGLGGAFGAVAGVVSTGVCVIAFGHMQVPGDIMGFEGVKRSRNGVIKPAESSGYLWVPVHSITAGLYDHLSTGSFSSSRPLAKWSPELERSTTLFHDTLDGGKGAVAMRPKAVETSTRHSCALKGRNGTAIGLTFGVKSLDHGNRLSITSAQIRLVGESNDETQVIHPTHWFNLWAKPEWQNIYEFDEDTDVVSSEPGANTSSFYFFFPTGETFIPRFIQVKGIRLALPEETMVSSNVNVTRLLSQADQNTSITGEEFVKRDIASSIKITKRFSDIRVGKNALPAGFTINGDNEIVSGNGVLQLGGKRPPRKLRIQGLAELTGTRLVAIDVSRGERACFYDANPSESDRVRLKTSPAADFSPVGYLFKDRRGLQVNLDPSSRFATVNDLPSLPSSGSQELILLFYITEGVEITGLYVGDTEIGYCSVQVTSNQ